VSYEFSAGLQAAVFRRLAGDPEVAALVGAAIHDAPLGPRADEATPDYVTLGEESVRANDTKTSRGAVHDFTVTAHSARDGFERVKRIAGAVCASLIDAPLELEAGRLVALRFLQAKAERGRAPEKRRVALRFRAVVDQDD
jgi:hypothetical protein